MFRLTLLLSGLGGLLMSRPDSPNGSLQIIFPEKIQATTSDNSEVENKEISYIIPIDEKPYTVHLKQRYFLMDNFMVYLYKQGSVNSHSSNIQAQCYYQGYVEGYPNSVVVLSTCSGLSGILQFENVSYGIEPLEAEIEFQHILYKIRNANSEFAIHTGDNRGIGQKPMDYNILISEKSESAAPDLIPLYLEMHVVVDKILYDYLGSDSMIVTNKIIEIIGLINSVFSQFKVTIVLSSLELWSDKNKISTVGEADELLHRFLEWKKSYLTLRPHDIAFLFVYGDYPDYVGAVFPGKMCVPHYSAGIALYPQGITLEAFSVIVTQMLGFSLGISYDDPKKCQCSGAICIMNPKAMQSSGVKTFSSCSLSDFKIFISNMGAKCLHNQPQMQRAPAAVCGNGKVESPEVCDCGTPAFQRAGIPCRSAVHPECDITEVCNGSSEACDPDITVLNGRTCSGRYICYNGDCHDLNERCKNLFGQGSTNAPFACYEEIQSQIDRFGNCGVVRGTYQLCQWRNLMCGRLICTYPSRSPFFEKQVAVLYAYVRDVICVTLDYRLNPPTKGLFVDPLAVHDGAECDTGRICVQRKCVESSTYQDQFLHCSASCNGHGVCNSEFVCHCDVGWSGPNCTVRSRKAYKETPGLIMERAFWKSGKNRWLLGFYTAVPVLLIATIIAISCNSLKKRFTKEEESLSSEGTLQLKDISYGIEPMEVLSDFTHLIYEEKDYNPNIPLVGDNDAYSHNISEYQDKKSSGRPEYFKLFSQYLDIYIVVDKNLFDYMGSDIKTVTQKVIQIIGLVNTYPEGSSLESYTVSIVQLLGLNVGLSFDNTDICFCSGDVCTMSPEAVHSLGVKEFSVCSLDEFKSIASNFELNCLHNTLSVKPVYKDTPVIKKVCGNGVLEQGEQCDCGTAKVEMKIST
ncbi:disintegrin and metalloproteinase domain-containing protein 32 [Rhynchonycteris naso]